MENTNSNTVKVIQVGAIALLKPPSVQYINQFIIGVALGCIGIILSIVASAQTTGKLKNANQGVGEAHTIMNCSWPVEMPTKQSGQMFEYLSIANGDQLSGGWLQEPLTVVFTQVDSLPVFGENAAHWQRILDAHKAVVVTSNHSNTKQNRVQISYLIDAKGKWYDVRFEQPVIQSISQKAMEILKAAGNCKPAKLNGNAVAYRGNLILDFE